jgi:hypothetical protein
MTPPLACRWNDSEVGMLLCAMRFTGDDGRDFGCGTGAINGLVVSKGPVEDLDLVGAPGRVVRLIGEGARDTLFIADMRDGVKGVFTSDRARCREGVLGLLNIICESAYIGWGNRSRVNQSLCS